MKNWLRLSAISDSFTGAVPNIFWGGGKLDALAAMGLNPPKGPVLTAAKKSSSEIQLDWTIEPAATSFLIERKVGEGGIFQPLTTVTGETTYLDAWFGKGHALYVSCDGVLQSARNSGIQ